MQTACALGPSYQIICHALCVANFSAADFSSLRFAFSAFSRASCVLNFAWMRARWKSCFPHRTMRLWQNKNPTTEGPPIVSHADLLAQATSGWKNAPGPSLRPSSLCLSPGVPTKLLQLRLTPDIKPLRQVRYRPSSGWTELLTSRLVPATSPHGHPSNQRHLQGQPLLQSNDSKALGALPGLSALAYR